MEKALLLGCKGCGNVIVECALAFGWHVDGLNQVFLDCDVALEPLYRRFGFEPVPGAGATLQPTLGFSMTAFQGTPDSLPVSMRKRVSDLARQFRAAGEAAISFQRPRSRGR